MTTKPRLHRSALALSGACLALLLPPAGMSADPAAGKELPVLLAEEFDDGADRWEPTDKAAWKVIEDDGRNVFALLKKQSDYQPPHRSPFNIALLRDTAVGDFVMDVTLKTTEKSYGHRSLCLFFGYRDPAHFYYVHLGQQADDHANQVFIVNDAPRTKISTKSTDGTPWKDGAWHHVRIVRTAEDGGIKVYFDDMDTPVMTASDKTFPSGRIGIGSFDDTGVFDSVTLRGTRAGD